MKGCLRIMHFGFLISVIVAVLGVVTAVDVSGEPPIVECPCDSESLPPDSACWTEQQGTNPEYVEVNGESEQCLLQNMGVPDFHCDISNLDNAPLTWIHLDIKNNPPQFDEALLCVS